MIDVEKVDTAGRLVCNLSPDGRASDVWRPVPSRHHKEATQRLSFEDSLPPRPTAPHPRCVLHFEKDRRASLASGHGMIQAKHPV